MLSDERAMTAVTGIPAKAADVMLARPWPMSSWSGLCLYEVGRSLSSAVHERSDSALVSA